MYEEIFYVKNHANTIDVENGKAQISYLKGY